MGRLINFSINMNSLYKKLKLNLKMRNSIIKMKIIVKTKKQSNFCLISS